MGQGPVLSVSIVWWLSRSPNTRKVPSSKLGGNSLLFKDVVCLGTSPSLVPLSKISSVPNGARASVICFHSVVVITFALHAKGPQFETGWKQSLVLCLETTFKLKPLSTIFSVPNGARASVICFPSVVVITFASHAKGPQFETGWKQSLVKGCGLSWHKSLTRPTFQDLFSSKWVKGQCYLFP